MYRLILSWICQRWQIQLQNDDKSTCNQEMYAAQICLWIQRPLPCAADETLQRDCTLHPSDIFQRFRFCKNSWLRHIWWEGMFSWQRDQRVLGPVSSTPPPPPSHLHYTTGTQTWQLSFHYNCTQQFKENALKSDSRDCCQIRQDPAAIRDF